jgi:hypothetical protein
MGHPSIDIAKSYREQLIQRHLAGARLIIVALPLRVTTKFLVKNLIFRFNHSIKLYHFGSFVRKYLEMWAIISLYASFAINLAVSNENSLQMEKNEDSECNILENG